MLEFIESLVDGDGLLLDHGLHVARDVEVVVVLPDLLQARHPAHAFDILVSFVPAMYVRDVLGKELVLGAARLELAGGIYEQYLLLTGLWLFLTEHEEAGRESCAVEEVRTEADDGVEQVHLQELAPDPTFLRGAEQHAVRQHHGHASGLRSHRADHVLGPGEVAILCRWHASEVASVGVLGPDLVPPLLQGERRVGDDAVERGEAPAGVECRVTQGISALYVEVLRAVEKEVHPGDGGGGQVLLLPVEVAEHQLSVAATLLYAV